MTTDSHTISLPNVVVGLAIALVGTALLLDRLGVARIQDLLRYWPVLLIAFGGSVIWQALRGSTDAGGRQQPIVAPGLIFAVVVISLVASLHGEWRSGAAGDPSVTMFGIVGQDTRVSDATAFRAAQMTSVMGGTRLDLREATIAAGQEAIVDVFGLMGKVELVVPVDWDVDVRTVPVMGRIDDTRPGRDRALDREESPASTAAGTGATPRLVVRGFVMMGSVDIVERPRAGNRRERDDES